MKRISSFVLILVVSICKLTAQNHYIIQWDRLQNDIIYFKVHYENGKRLENQITKPFLKEGDLLEGKIVNVNEFIYEPMISVNKKYLSPNVGSNFLGKALGGLGLMNLGSGFFGAIAAISDLSQNQNSLNIGSRGESASNTQKQKITNWEKTLIADIKTINYEINNIKKAESEYVSLNQIVYSEVLNLVEFKNDALKQIEKLKKLQLVNSIMNLNKSADEIQSVFDLAKNEGLLTDIDKDLQNNSAEILKIYRDLNADSMTAYFSDIQIQALEKEIMAADFTYSNKLLIEDWETKVGYDTKVISVEETNYNVDFQLYRKKTTKLSLNQSSESSNSEGGNSTEKSFNDLVCHKLVSVNTESPMRPLWTTGIIFQIPWFKNNFVQTNKNYWRDTIRFSNGKSIPGGVAISTQLMFELGNFEKVIPNFSIGVSYLINGFKSESSQSESSNMSVLIGGGLRTRGFKYFSLNTGISLSQIQILNNNLKLGTLYSVDDLENIGITTDNYLENGWIPSFYLGIGFHF
jgi:hypothetical protein